MRFGQIELDVPPDWWDESIITLVKRKKARGPGSKVAQIRENFIVTRAYADGSFGAAELAASHFRSLKNALPDLEIVEEETMEIDGAQAISREVRFKAEDGSLVQQLHVFLLRGGSAFTMIGTGSAGLIFKGLKKEGLVSLARSFHFVD